MTKTIVPEHHNSALCKIMHDITIICVVCPVCTNLFECIHTSNIRQQSTTNLVVFPLTQHSVQETTSSVKISYKHEPVFLKYLKYSTRFSSEETYYI